jgi:hypothetical protein
MNVGSIPARRTNLTLKEHMSNRDNSTDIAIQEFLARGGTIQKIEPNVSGRVEGASYSAWGRPKKPVAAPVAEETEVVLDEIEEEDIDAEDIIVVDSEEVDEE